MISGVSYPEACAVERPPSPLRFEQAISDWCAGSTSTEAGDHHTVELSSCAGTGSSQYWRADIEESCCTDIAIGYEYVWTKLGLLVYSRQWGQSGGGCCCGEDTSELIYGTNPDLTCEPADPVALCE